MSCDGLIDVRTDSRREAFRRLPLIPDPPSDTVTHRQSETEAQKQAARRRKVHKLEFLTADTTVCVNADMDLNIFMA